MVLLTKPKVISIIRDDREKKAWDEKFLGHGFEVSTKRLQTGDYTVKGMENLVCIEKKEDWAEIAYDVSCEKNRTNFIALLRRMQQFPIRFMVVHDDLGSLANMRTYGKLDMTRPVYNWVLNIPLEYGIPLIPAGARRKSQYVVTELFRRIVEFHKVGRVTYLPTR